jgi:hypothetical protein
MLYFLITIYRNYIISLNLFFKLYYFTYFFKKCCDNNLKLLSFMRIFQFLVLTTNYMYHSKLQERICLLHNWTTSTLNWIFCHCCLKKLLFIILFIFFFNLYTIQMNCPTLGELTQWIHGLQTSFLT